MILSDLCVAAGLTCPADAEQIAVSGICTDSTKLTQFLHTRIPLSALR